MNKRIRELLDSFEKEYPGRTEEELVLKMNKSELLDTHTILPHAELNGMLYESVNRFIERYNGSSLNITIVSDRLSPEVQDVIREAYHAHYLDEFVKINRYLNRRYIRVVSLIIISIAAFALGTYLTNHFENIHFLTYAATQLSVFCLWEIGYTHFDRSNASIQKKHIVRALNAKIDFM